MAQMDLGEWYGVGGRAVSPVIGVVLMVAIVVILAATVGVFVTQFGDDTEEKAPSIGATVEYDQSTSGTGQSITIEPKSGDNIAVSTLTIAVTGAEAVGPGGSTSSVEYTGNALSTVGTELTAGDTLTIDKTHFEKSGGGSLGTDEHLDLSDATVRLIWEDGPDTSETIFEWQGQHNQ